MTNPNNCDGCDWSRDKRGGGHCYMFRDAPDEICYQHTARKEPDILSLFSAARRGLKPGEGLEFSLLNTNPADGRGVLPESDKDLAVAVQVIE